MEILLDLNKTRGTTLIIVTHDPEIAAMTKRIVQILDGVIVDQGDNHKSSTGVEENNDDLDAVDP